MKNDPQRLIGAASDKGPVRAANEDACRVPQAKDPVHLGALYVVADGVGGQAHGAAAAELATRVVAETFYALRGQGEAVPAALAQALHAANTAVYEEAQLRGGGRMGCTLVAAVADAGQLQIAHVGDARAYLARDAQLQPLTRDDTWVQRQVEAGLITAEQAARHELRNVVTQVLGNKLDIQVHLSKPRPLAADDVLLLCSDGLYDAVPAAEILRLLLSLPAQQAASALVETAVAHAATDNITAVVVRGAAVDAAAALPDGASPGSGAPPAGRRPSWLLLGLLALLLLLGVAAVLLGLRRGGAAAGVPTAAPAAVVPSLPQLATAAPQQATVTPLPTSTVAPTATPEAAVLPAQTAVSTLETAVSLPPATPPLLRCVVYVSVPLWPDASLTAGCSQFAQVALPAGTQLQLLDPAPRQVNGPDAACQPNSFLHVQVVATPELAGWVLADALAEAPPGGCQP